MLTKAPILTLLELGKDFVVYNDTSLNGLGCFLMQDGKHRWIELLKDYKCVIDYHRRKAMFAQLSISSDGSALAELTIKLILFEQIRKGCLRFHNLFCVLDVANLKELILHKPHDSLFFMHPGGTKIYRDLRELYWWPGMKRVIVKFVEKCFTC
ncbi:integrase [Gossypium australe]|uniref:Integrase n=1 Tax=Gossypium australe TaxID=47621 RepID=A0A5B6WH83_9ROSI|nr:integrase [Gossypium australe]